MKVAMKGQKVLYSLLMLFLAGVGIITAKEGILPQYKSSEKAFYLSEADLSFIRPGLSLVIQKAEVAPSNVSVTFRIADDRGQGLDRLGIQTPGPVAPRFLPARLKPGVTQ